MYDWSRVWRSSKSLFNPKKIEQVFKDELPHSNFRLGLFVFVAAAILAAVFAVIIKAEEIHFGIFRYNTMSEVVDIGQAAFNAEPVMTLAAFMFIFFAPFVVIFSLVFERVMYQVFKITGGKATFTQQYYLASLVGLTTAFATALGLAVPLPCIGIFAGLAVIALSVYLAIYVSSKSYEAAHQIQFIHALVVVLVFLVPRLLVISFVMREASLLFGVPEYYMIGVENV